MSGRTYLTGMGIRLAILILCCHGSAWAAKGRGGGGELDGDGKVRLHGWNAFVAFRHYPVAFCTVPKVGCTAMRQWILERAPDQLKKCRYEIMHDNSKRSADPSCKSLSQFRNLTKYKRSGMTKFKAHCRQRHDDASEYLLGKEKCMSFTNAYIIVRQAAPESLQRWFSATFVRHPVDRFISWFVDKVLMSSSDHVLRHVPRKFKLYHLSEAGYGISEVIKLFYEMKQSFHTCNPVLDEHYASQWCMCRHDVVPYSYIGRLESIKRDWPELVDLMRQRWSGAPGTELELPAWLPSDMNVKYSNPKTRHVRGNMTMDDVLRYFM